MLKGIVNFFKAFVTDSTVPDDLFALRLGDDCLGADQRQWNGGRHLTFKELDALGVNNAIETKNVEKHVS